jgi:hypothetical protein
MTSHTAPLAYEVYFCLSFPLWTNHILCSADHKTHLSQTEVLHNLFSSYVLKVLQMSKKYFPPNFALQNVGASYGLYCMIIWHTSFWVWKKYWMSDSSGMWCCHWLCSSRFSSWATWSWSWRHYIPLMYQGRTHQVTWCHIPEEFSLQQYSCENLESHYRANILQMSLLCFAGHHIISGATSDPVHWSKSWC